MSVFDAKIDKNRMIFLNAQTMKVDSDTTLPIRLPMVLHSQFFPVVWIWIPILLLTTKLIVYQITY